MENINWGCLGIQIAITGIVFYYALIDILGVLNSTEKDPIKMQ